MLGTKKTSMKLTELLLNRFLYRDTKQNSETKDSSLVSADSSEVEPEPIPSGGAAQDLNTGNVEIDGSVIEPGTIPSTTLDVSNWGWTQSCAFSSTDLNTVSWGAGTFTSANGVSYSIGAGNTGNMAAKTYIYLDINVSEIAYQITTTSADSVGVGKVLVAVAEDGATDATYNLQEANQIVSDNILANTIDASKMNVGQLSAISANIGTITAGSINGVTIAIGTGDAIFKADASGIYLGNATFADAPFNVDMAGNAKVSSLMRDDFHWFTVFESADGYSKITDGAGTISSSTDGVTITTGAVVDNDCELAKILGRSLMSWDQNSKFKCQVKPTSNSSQEIYITMGHATSNSAITKHYGFYLLGNNINATVADGVNGFQTPLTTFSAGANIVLEAELDASTGIIKYYVNGVLELTGDTDGTPTGSGNYTLNARVRTKDTAARILRLVWWDFWQAND